MSNDIGLDPDAAEGVAKVIELLDLIEHESGSVAAAREVLTCVGDATRAVENSSVHVAYSELDLCLTHVLALDPGAHEWPGVERLVEDIGALRVAAERSPDMLARDIYAYGTIRDGLDMLWTAVRRAVMARERLGDGSVGLDGAAGL